MIHRVFLLLFFLNYFNSFSQLLKIKLFNKTGFTIDSLNLNQQFLGRIKNSESIVISSFKEITLHDEFPFEQPNAVIKNKIRNVEVLLFCGIGRTIVSSGNYQFDIMLREDKLGYSLFWSFHK